MSDVHTADIGELPAESEWLARIARGLAADDPTAGDLVQETWVAALTRPPRHDGTRSWLRGHAAQR